MDNVFELKHSLQNLEKRILAFFTVHLPDSKQSQTDQIRFRVRQNRYVLLTVLYQIFLNLPKSQSQGKPDEMRVSVLTDLVTSCCLLVNLESVPVLQEDFQYIDRLIESLNELVLVCLKLDPVLL